MKYPIHLHPPTSQHNSLGFSPLNHQISHKEDASMISYLTHTIQKETGMWFSILPKNNHFPHAPWWHWKDGVQEGWMFNPSAELVAFLIHRSSEQSEAYQIGWSAIEIAINHVMNVKEMDRHQINNYQRLLKVWGMQF